MEVDVTYTVWYQVDMTELSTNSNQEKKEDAESNRNNWTLQHSNVKI